VRGRSSDRTVPRRGRDGGGGSTTRRPCRVTVHRPAAGRTTSRDRCPRLRQGRGPATERGSCRDRRPGSRGRHARRCSTRPGSHRRTAPRPTPRMRSRCRTPPPRPPAAPAAARRPRGRRSWPFRHCCTRAPSKPPAGASPRTSREHGASCRRTSRHRRLHSHATAGRGRSSVPDARTARGSPPATPRPRPGRHP